jgi:predicted HTH domain antitoxin
MQKETVMKETVVTYPEGLPQLLKMSDREFAVELRFLAAAKLYELGQLSSGKAAQLAEMDRITFLRELARVGVSAINLRDEEIDAEVQAAKDVSS